MADKLCAGDFAYRSNMACQVLFILFSPFFSYLCFNFVQWHDEEDKGVHCSLTIARNYAYTISDLCCDSYKISLLPNRHCPAEVIDETKYEVKPKMARQEVPSVSYQSLIFKFRLINLVSFSPSLQVFDQPIRLSKNHRSTVFLACQPLLVIGLICFYIYLLNVHYI